MNEKIRARLIRTASLCLIGLFIGVSIAFFQIKNEAGRVIKTDAATAEMKSMPGIQIGGPFTLTDENGNRVTEKTWAGRYKIVYFGFTMCPMICPTGLQKISKALELMGPEGENIQPILITVDPERDTPDVLKQYTQQFHPRIIGLTGPKADIETVQKSYRVFANKVQDDKMSDYTMDHSAFAYLMGPNDELLALYRDADTAEMMATDMKDKIEFGWND